MLTAQRNGPYHIPTIIYICLGICNQKVKIVYKIFHSFTQYLYIIMYILIYHRLFYTMIATAINLMEITLRIFFICVFFCHLLKTFVSFSMPIINK